MSLQIFLFGRFAILQDDQAIVIPSTVSRNLLACLLLAPAHTRAREWLSTQLWPDATPEEGRRRLAQALYLLRRALGHDRFFTTHNCIGLNPADLWVDLWAFDRLARSTAAADWEQAVALYTGDLLPDVYDDWALLPQRERQEQWFVLLDRLADHYQVQGDLAAALRYARRLVEADPLREEAQQRLLRLLGRAGRANEALAHYERLRRLLRTELNADPLPETTAIVRGIRRESVATASGDAAPDIGPFVGRATERRQIVERLEQALQGRGALLAVEGESGIGKTRLLQEVAASARWRGLTPLMATAAPGRSAADLLAEALRGLPTVHRHALAARLPLETRAAAGLLPAWRHAVTLPPLPPALELARQRQAVRDLFTVLCAQTPLCLMLDDLHHAADDLWPLLDELAQVSQHAALCLILAYRPSEMQLHRAPIAAWEEAGRLTVVALGPLADDDAGRLIPPQLADRREALLRTAGGNPFWLHEAIAAVAAGFPPTAPIAERAAALPAVTCAALQAAAVWGMSYTWAQWRGLTPVTPAIAAELVAAGFLRADADGFAFSHELVQQAIYAAIAPDRRRAWHRQAAAYLAELTPDDLAGRARHHAAGDEPAVALDLYRRLAEQCRRKAAPAEACAALGHALTLLATDDPQRLPILLDWADLSLIVAEAEAGDAVDEALRLAQAAADADLVTRAHLLAGRYRRKRGEFEAAVAHLQSAAALAQQAGHIPHLADALQELGSVAIQVGDVAAAQVHYARLRDLAHDHGLTLPEAEALEGLGWALANLGDPDHAALDLFRQALALRRRTGDRYAEACGLIELASALQAAGRLDEAVTVGQEAVTVSEQVGYGRGAARARAALAMTYISLGRYDLALPLAEAACDYCIHSAAQDGVGLYTGMCGLALERMGRPEEAESLLRQAAAILHGCGALFLAALVQMDLGTLLARQGRYAEARPALEAALAVFTDNQAPMERERTAALLGLACWHSGDAARAHELAAAGWAQFNAHAPEGEERQYYLWALWRLLTATGRVAEARQVLAEANATLQRQAARLADPELRHSFFANVPVNRELAAAYTELAGGPSSRTVRLARRETPLGRPLSDADYVAVVWTPHAPEDTLIADKGDRRRAVLRRLLTEAAAQGAAPTDDDLATALGVSRRTVLRDMELLAAAGDSLPTRKRRSAAGPQLS
ncbi:MAG: hypothetical protein BroJett021_09590 [Chloroflexota bacterium]|nr:tetratricopeptide repeat protein [Caldilinea sp.]GIK71971.1 MAG: hypothetical protein BroJett021_09590 [Chloroflexota bacterium]